MQCGRFGYVVEADIEGFFNHIDHDKLLDMLSQRVDDKRFLRLINKWLKAVEKHTEEKWVLLYIERWLKAPIELRGGAQFLPDKGTPQGGVISPLLANLFLHYAFDKWMEREFPGIPFARYADDAICHCKSEAQAEMLKRALTEKMKEVELEMHPEKTKIVYCKDEDRMQTYPCTSFDFLGYTFRARRSKNRYGKYFINFSPAISNKAGKAIRQEIRRWKLHLRSDKSLEDLAWMFNSKIQGWINYYGCYYKSAMYPTLRCLDCRLA